MKFNPSLFHDCNITEKDLERDEVRRYYVARVIAKGTWQDHRDVGLENIRQYLPKVAIPKEKRIFWEWYFKDGEKYVDHN